LKALRRPLLAFLLAFLSILAVVPSAHAGKRIGVIMSGDIPYYREIHQAFVDELKKRTDGAEGIEIILQRPFPNPISWSNAARKLIAFDVDLIVTYGEPATQAALHEKSDIPLVYSGVYDPDQISFSSKNVTGSGFKIPLSSILRYFKHLKRITSLGIAYSGIEEDSVRQYESMKLLATQQNIKVENMDVRSRENLDKLKMLQSDAIFLTGSSLVHLLLDDILAILEKEKVPAADIFPDDGESGVLMTLYQPAQIQGQTTAEIVGQILKGKRPADIAPRTMRDTELVFNLVEARRLGITFPIQLLIEATRVIE